MNLTADHILTIPKLLETSTTRRVLVLNLSHNQIGIDGAMLIA